MLSWLICFFVQLKSTLSFAQIFKTNQPIQVLTCTQTFTRRWSRSRQGSRHVRSPSSRKALPTPRNVCWSEWKWRQAEWCLKAPCTLMSDYTCPPLVSLSALRCYPKCEWKQNDEIKLHIGQSVFALFEKKNKTKQVIPRVSYQTKWLLCVLPGLSGQVQPLQRTYCLIILSNSFPGSRAWSCFKAFCRCQGVFEKFLS